MLVRLLVIGIVCAALTACASNRAGPPVPASEVQLYNSTQLIPTQYDVVDRIWIDTWRSAFTYPTFASADDALAVMKEEAGQVGATGILNVMCMDWTRDRQLCYGDAIKFVK